MPPSDRRPANQRASTDPVAGELGAAQAEIMNVIWEKPEGEWCTVREVYETMLPERHIAYTTVMNTMTRLAKKGVLESRRQDMAYLYRPHQSRDGFA